MIDLDKYEEAIVFKQELECGGVIAVGRDDLLHIIDRLRQAEKDAARYRFLRGFHWSESPMCVVTDPSSAIKLGSNCPSREFLDAAIDEAMQCK